jgi:hypothetical protein
MEVTTSMQIGQDALLPNVLYKWKISVDNKDFPYFFDEIYILCSLETMFDNYLFIDVHSLTCGLEN